MSSIPDHIRIVYDPALEPSMRTYGPTIFDADSGEQLLNVHDLRIEWAGKGQECIARLTFWVLSPAFYGGYETVVVPYVNPELDLLVHSTRPTTVRNNQQHGATQQATQQSSAFNNTDATIAFAAAGEEG
jgi:hypothetical protein